MTQWQKVFEILEKGQSKIKPKIRIEDDGRRDKGAGEDKTKVGKEEEDLEDLSKYISSNLEGFNFIHLYKLYVTIVVKQYLILLKIKSFQFT